MPQQFSQNAELPSLTVSQKRAAQILDVCVDTIENMVARGELERVRVTSRKYGITWRSLQKLVGEAA
jgi:hypothetical protein